MRKERLPGKEKKKKEKDSSRLQKQGTLLQELNVVIHEEQLLQQKLRRETRQGEGTCKGGVRWTGDGVLSSEKRTAKSV